MGGEGKRSEKKVIVRARIFFYNSAEMNETW